MEKIDNNEIDNNKIDNNDEYIQKNLPKKYLNAFSDQLDDLLEKAYYNFYELRAAGGIEDPPGYDGEEPCEDAITGRQLYTQLLYIFEEMEQAVRIIEKAMIRWRRVKLY
jgi:hypothetical protein